MASKVLKMRYSEGVLNVRGMKGEMVPGVRLQLYRKNTIMPLSDYLSFKHFLKNEKINLECAHYGKIFSEDTENDGMALYRSNKFLFNPGNPPTLFIPPHPIQRDEDIQETLVPVDALERIKQLVLDYNRAHTSNCEIDEDDVWGPIQ